MDWIMRVRNALFLILSLRLARLRVGGLHLIPGPRQLGSPTAHLYEVEAQGLFL